MSAWPCSARTGRAWPGCRTAEHACGARRNDPEAAVFYSGARPTGVFRGQLPDDERRGHRLCPVSGSARVRIRTENRVSSFCCRLASISNTRHWIHSWRRAEKTDRLCSLTGIGGCFLNTPKRWGKPAFQGIRRTGTVSWRILGARKGNPGESVFSFQGPEGEALVGAMAALYQGNEERPYISILAFDNQLTGAAFLGKGHILRLIGLSIITFLLLYTSNRSGSLCFADGLGHMAGVALKAGEGDAQRALRFGRGLPRDRHIGPGARWYARCPSEKRP